jgi:hypothetical protein
MSKISLQEKLGVPDNLIQTASTLYGEILERLKKELNGEDLEYSFTFSPSSPYKIGDSEISKISINIEIFPDARFEEVDYQSMGFKSPSKYVKPGVTRIVNDINQVELTIEIVSPEEYNPSDVIDWFTNSKREIVSSLSHELKHAYDAEKSVFQKMSSRSSYNAANNTRFNLPPLDKLAFNIYYTHMVENLVRPTEIMAYLEEDKINKKRFLSYLKSNRTYTKLMDVMNWNLPNAMNEIKNNHMDRVEQILELVDEDMEGSTDKEKVLFILDLWVRNYLKNNFDSFVNQMGENFMESLFGFSVNKSKAIDRHISRMSKIKDPLKFIQYEENLTKTIASKVIRKISKLYDLLPD